MLDRFLVNFKKKKKNLATYKTSAYQNKWFPGNSESSNIQNKGISGKNDFQVIKKSSNIQYISITEQMIF
jgi:hypothetical protein